MSRVLRSPLGAFLATVLLAVPLSAQSAQETPAAPVPMQITSAKKIFVSNAGEETSYWIQKSNEYSGGSNRAYNKLYAAMRTWGRYELVSTPQDADIVFEIHFEDHDPHGTPPQFRLLILDPKTRTTLWAFTGYVEPANRTKTRDKNYNLALDALVNEVKTLVSTQTAAMK